MKSSKQDGLIRSPTSSAREAHLAFYDVWRPILGGRAEVPADVSNLPRRGPAAKERERLKRRHTPTELLSMRYKALTPRTSK